MKMTIRQGVFETNSSSSHSLTITTLENYNNWKKGELYFGDCVGFIKIAEFEELLIKEGITREEHPDEKEYNEYVYDFKMENEIYTYDDYHEVETMGISLGLNHYTTPGGEQIVVFGEVSEYGW